MLSTLALIGCGQSSTPPPGSTAGPATPAAQTAQEGTARPSGDAGEAPADPSKFYKKPGYSPYAGRVFPQRPLWGDQHLHTGWSMDAGVAGATLSPEDAVRFARGAEVMASSGQPAKLTRPLDWLVVSDHSDGIGIIAEIRAKNPELMADPVTKRWGEMMAKGGADAQAAVVELVAAQSQGKLPKAFLDPKFMKSTWEKNTAIMEKYNDPGRFTAFIGYEWTSNAGGGDNLHRNVIYRDGKDKADQVLPLTTFQTQNPEDLWKWMTAWEQKTGGKLLAIPHNGNLSNGRMFALTTFEGNPMTREWAEERRKWEPLFEVAQIKGQSEAHPRLAPNDEFLAGYELWDKGNLILVPKKPGMLEHEYVRDALKNGLKVERDLGVNPFKFGLVGGTDAHTGLAAVEEDNYYGKVTGLEPRPDRWDETFMKRGDLIIKGWETSASGYAAVWAMENTRGSIWDAMKRRETYATSGPRMTVRFFGGFDFNAKDVSTRSPAIAGYTKGVPMGGDLSKAPAGKAPTFLVAALRDPIGGNLDRIQIVKGWLGKDGKPQERIYNVVWSDAATRKPDAKGKLTPVGNTVDVANATWTNTIGAPELMAVWKDPAFDPAAKAFYYVRVLEIPTPRWTAYDAAYFKVRMPNELPMITVERAWTSPIWYTP
jgi:hypothetical protein